MALGHRHEIDVVVGAERLAGIEIARRRVAGVAGARRRPGAPARAEGAAPPHEERHGLLHREVDQLTPAGAQLLRPGGQHGHRRVHPGAGIAHRSGYRRGPVRLPVDRERAGRRLRDRLLDREAGVRAAASETLDACVDQSRRNGAQRFVVDAEPLHHAGPEVLHEDVEPRHEAQEQRVARAAADVDRQAPLVGVPGAEQGGVRLVAGAVRAAGPVAAPGPLDLHDVGAQPGQRLRAGGTGLELRQVEDPQTVQCRHDAPSARRLDRLIGRTDGRPWPRRPWRRCGRDPRRP